MSKQKKELKFEDKLDLLEQLAEKLEQGELSLEELLSTYEEGIILASSLKKELECSQAKILELKEGKLKPLEEI
jgi:exodeoxyribonuclease VII small subunit